MATGLRAGDLGGLRAGQFASAAGVSIETVRYYERRGLLRPPHRTPGGDRRYDDEALRVVRFIKRAQRLGFSLGAITEFLRLWTREAPCPEVRAAAAKKVAEIAAKRRELAEMQATLEMLMRTCDRGDGRRCAMLDALFAESEPVPRRSSRRLRPAKV